jgi:hypothetical protein
MLFWASGIENTIRMLKSIRCDAVLSQHICALLREYRLIRFLTLGGNYHILFKNWRPISSLVRERYRLLRQYWEEVLCSHQCSFLTTQASSILGKERFVLDDVWEESQFLAEMERGLCRALSQKNCRDIGRNRKTEATFFGCLKSNPIWIKLYGYEPYISLISE